MPAVSKQQQKLMGLALAYKRGKVDDDQVSDEIKELAKSMSEKELEKFAETKHKGLPDTVDEETTTASAGVAASDVADIGPRRRPKVLKRFKDFYHAKKKKDDDERPNY